MILTYKIASQTQMLPAPSNKQYFKDRLYRRKLHYKILVVYRLDAVTAMELSIGNIKIEQGFDSRDNGDEQQAMVEGILSGICVNKTDPSPVSMS